MGYKFYIIRHADAEQQNYDRDFERRITHYGITQCESAVTRMKKVFPKAGIVFCSSAVRTSQTFEKLAFPPEWTVVKSKKLYEAELDVLSELIRENNAENEKILALVGHNPFVSELASYLSGTRLKMGTCDICCLTCDEDVKSITEALDMVGCWEATAI